MREALGWSAFYVALPRLRRVGVGPTAPASASSTTPATSSKSLRRQPVRLHAPAGRLRRAQALQQRVLLIGVVGALLLRGVFIALGAQMLENRLDVPALRPGSPRHRHQVPRKDMPCRAPTASIDISRMRCCACGPGDAGQGRVPRHEHDRPRRQPLALTRWRWSGRHPRHRHRVRGRLGPCRLRHHRRPVPRLRHQRLRPARAARALLRAGGRAVPAGVHTGYGLAAILGFIGVELVHWARHLASHPEVPTLASLGVIVAILAVVTGTSLRATSGSEGNRRRTSRRGPSERTWWAQLRQYSQRPQPVPEPARGPGSRCRLDLRVAGTAAGHRQRYAARSR